MRFLQNLGQQLTAVWSGMSLTRRVVFVLLALGAIGVSAGVKCELNLLALMGTRARILGSTLRARPLEEKALAARRLEHEVLPLFAQGALTVPLAEVFPLEQAPAAYERFAAGGKLGKIVLVTG